jgi:tRNA threonylcarbamoyladenosine biosynthesis protein TsaE
VQGIVEGLGVPAEVANSPTFVLIQEYAGRLPVCHVDAYRLRDSDEFVELGADELLGSEMVCLIEWGDRVADVLPRDRLRVTIEATGESTRRFTIEALGSRNASRLNELNSLDRPAER